ncbi:MAG: shikimate dehydrogenase [Chloroflexota bacterium]|nr:shikimate dehydrogenase [Chloroflexota bacterium]
MTRERLGSLRVGLIGDPVAHSLSPAIQQPALDALGVPATYELWRTPASELGRRLADLRAPQVLGANVTVPHKVAVLDLIDDISESARRAGAVNTIVCRDERLIGENTDVHGFATALAEACPDVAGRPALILGAGGAARAVALALGTLGIPDVSVANRDRGRAERLAADLAPASVRVAGLDEEEVAPGLATARLLINATSLGWHRGEMPLPADLLSRLPEDALVVDLTYRETDLLAAAASRGLATLDGLSMLVHQGARALELWTGRAAPLDVMMSAARRARDDRATP